MRTHVTRMTACCLAALCALGTGCHLAVNATRTVGAEIKRRADEHKEGERNRELADTMWMDISSRSAGFSDDYASGFKDGFCDYLDAGGTGHPPAVPPRRYLTFSNQKPEGYQAMDDWFTGFRHGAAAAAASGYRRYIEIPPPVGHGVAVLPAAHVEAAPSFAPMPRRVPDAAPKVPPQGGAEVLPALPNPRKDS